MKLYANLHSHSTHSDGVYSPRELVNVAKNEGYHAIALTDHDTATGFGELKAECDRVGMDCVFGCEFSSPFEELGCTYHIVGFNFDAEYEPMKRYLEMRGASETDQTRILTERGLREGLISGFTWDDVLKYNDGIAWLCNNHVFNFMKNAGLATDADYQKFFHTVFGKRRGEIPPLYDFMPGREILKLINSAGGFAVIAHPASIYGNVRDIPELIRMGARGVEVWHSILSKEERLVALNEALKNDLFISGGSDHEGLCGGFYSTFEKPEETKFWAPECSLGTTEEFFREIKSGKLSDDRADYIKAYIESI